MVKQDVAMVRKQFAPDKCAIDRIYLCYVDRNSGKKSMFSESFASIPDEEAEKYLSFFKKGLGGSLGKNLFSLSFPLDEERPGGKQEALMRLWEAGKGGGSRPSGGEIEDEMEGFCQRIIGSYDTDSDKYCIVAAYGACDIPAKKTDAMDGMGGSEDSWSDAAYSYMVICICPVRLEDTEIGYDAENGRIGQLPREWTLQAPDKAFLFPALADRAQDIHEALYYSRKAEDLQPGFAEELFGTAPPMSANDQKEAFDQLIEEALGDECGLEEMKELQGQIIDHIGSHQDSEDAGTLDMHGMRTVLVNSGIPEERLGSFEESFEQRLGRNGTLSLPNVFDAKSCRIDLPGIEIKVSQEYIDRVGKAKVDGRDCLVIPIEDTIGFNGIEIKA